MKKLYSISKKLCGFSSVSSGILALVIGFYSLFPGLFFLFFSYVWYKIFQVFSMKLWIIQDIDEDGVDESMFK